MKGQAVNTGKKRECLDHVGVHISPAHLCPHRESGTCKLSAGAFVRTLIPSPHLPIPAPPNPMFSFPIFYFLLIGHEEVRRHMTTLVIRVKETDRQPEKKIMRQD